jgi:HIRAN domain
MPPGEQRCQPMQMRLFRRSKDKAPEPALEFAPEAGDDEAADVGVYDDADYAPSWYVPHDGDKTRFIGPGGLPALHLITYTDRGGETVLRLCEDSTGLLVGPTDSRLPAAGVYVSQLRGEFYHQDACKAGDFSPGQPVTLKREPHNEFDKNAVAVYDATGHHLAAYVNKQKARLLAKLIDGGEVLSAISIRGTRAGADCEQVAILAAKPIVLDRLTEPRPRQFPTPAHLR